MHDEIKIHVSKFTLMTNFTPKAEFSLQLLNSSLLSYIFLFLINFPHIYALSGVIRIKIC